MENNSRQLYNEFERLKTVMATKKNIYLQKDTFQKHIQNETLSVETTLEDGDTETIAVRYPTMDFITTKMHSYIYNNPVFMSHIFEQADIPESKEIPLYKDGTIDIEEITKNRPDLHTIMLPLIYIIPTNGPVDTWECGIVKSTLDFSGFKLYLDYAEFDILLIYIIYKSIADLINIHKNIENIPKMHIVIQPEFYMNRGISEFGFHQDSGKNAGIRYEKVPILQTIGRRMKDKTGRVLKRTLKNKYGNVKKKWVKARPSIETEHIDYFSLLYLPRDLTTIMRSAGITPYFSNSRWINPTNPRIEIPLATFAVTGGISVCIRDQDVLHTTPLINTPFDKRYITLDDKSKYYDFTSIIPHHDVVENPTPYAYMKDIIKEFERLSSNRSFMRIVYIIPEWDTKLNTYEYIPQGVIGELFAQTSDSLPMPPNEYAESVQELYNRTIRMGNMEQMIRNRGYGNKKNKNSIIKKINKNK